MNELEKFYLKNKKAIEFALYKVRKFGYTSKIISKKNGQDRNLSIPPLFVRNMQRIFNKELQKIYKAPKPVHGFVDTKKGDVRTIVTNAKQHTNKKILINIDIENFFDTINFGRVRGLFKSKPFNTQDIISTKLSQLIIYDNKLPQGSPTSPIISNMICKKMDHELIQFAKMNRLIYTRYADDITFSSNRRDIHFDSKIIVKKIETILISNGFIINGKKTRVQPSYLQQKVTGLIVNQKVNLDRKFVRQIKSMLFSWYKHGLKEATNIHFEKYNKQPLKYKSNSKEDSFKNIIMGKINFLGQVKGTDNPIYNKFRHSFYLLNDNFSLTKKFEEFEELDLHNLKNKFNIFPTIYDSILIFTEGITDIMYIKSALKYYQEKESKFLNLKLRYCSLGSWSNLQKLHQVLFEKRNNKLSLEIVNLRKCIFPYINSNLTTCFILDCDDSGIENHFDFYDRTNYFLIARDIKGYIENLFDKTQIIEIIKKYGITIDTRSDKLQDSTKKALNKYKNDTTKITSEEIHTISSTAYIAYKDKVLSKTSIAEHVISSEDTNYNGFKQIFEYLEEMKHYKGYVKPLCNNSIY